MNRPPFVEMYYRMELTLMWHDLEATLVEEVRVRPQLNGKGLWWAQPKPAVRGVLRQLMPQSRNALKTSVLADRNRPLEVMPRHVRSAQSLCIQALDHFGLSGTKELS